MGTEEYPKDTGSEASTLSAYRVGLVIIITTLTISYTVAILAGLIPEGRKIDTITLAIIALAIFGVFLVMHPRALDRLKTVKAGGFELEMLEKVREKQAIQETALKDIALILPLLFPKAEQKHLFNLADGKTSNYKGHAALRVELRRLRSIGLIQSRPDMYISDIGDDSKVDLAKYVELTSLGERWVKRIREIERSDDDNV